MRKWFYNIRYKRYGIWDAIVAVEGRVIESKTIFNQLIENINVI